MALVVADRVKETTTTTGTGTYTLAGAATGFESFSAIGNANTTYYCCTDGTDFEVGIGTYTASGTTLARTTILQSSNSDSAVNWSAGTRDIFCTQPAEKAVFLDGSGDVSIPGQIKLSKTSGIAIETTGNLGNADLTLLSANSGTSGQYGFDIIYKGTRSGNANSFALNMHNQTSTDVEAITVYQDGKVGINNTAPTAPLDVTGNIVVSGTVDGRDLSVDGAKLDGIESGATADQTKADIDALNIDAATLDSLDSTQFLRSDAADSFSQQIDGTTIELAGGVTYDPPGTTGTETATDVGLALQSGQRIVLGYDGYIRTIVDAQWGQPLEIGQSGTSAFTNTEIYGGSQGVKLFYNTSTKLQTTADGVTITSTDADAGTEPLLVLYRDSASPADSDDLGQIIFRGVNDADQDVNYASIFAEAIDVSDGTEDGQVKIEVMDGGSLNSHMRIGNDFTTFDSNLLITSGNVVFFEGSTNDAFETQLTVTDPTADRTIALPDRDGMVRVVDQQTMTANLAVGWHTIAVFQGRDDSGSGNQRFHAKFSLADLTSSRHQAMTFYAQSLFGQDEGLQIIGNSTFGTDVVTAIRIKSSTDGNGLYAGAVIQVYVANATNNLILFLDEANLDNNEGGVSYGNVILKTGVADASDPGDVGYSTASYSTFAEDVQIATDSIEPGGIGVTGNLLTQSNIVLEGATADAHETIITATDATADRTITLPNATGTVITTGNLDDLSNFDYGLITGGVTVSNDYGAIT